jgi:hypothetical protein
MRQKQFDDVDKFLALREDQVGPAKRNRLNVGGGTHRSG